MTQKEYQALQEQRQLDEIRSLLWTSQAPLDQQNLRALGGPPTVPPRLQTPMTLDQNPQPADMGQFAPSSPGLDMNMDTPIQRGADRRGALDMAMVNEGTLHQPAPMSGPEQDAWDLTQFYRGLPAELRVATVEGGAPTLLSVFGAKRQQAALEMEKLKQTALKDQWDQAFKIMQAGRPWSETKKMLSSQASNPYARLFSQIGDDKFVAEIEHLSPYFDQEKLALLQKDPQQFLQSVGGPAGAELLIDQARERQKVTLQDKEKARQLQGKIEQFKTDPVKMSETDYDEVKKFIEGQEKRKLEAQELKERLKGLELDNKRKANAPSEVYSGVQGNEGEVVTGIYDPKLGAVREMRGTPINKQEILPTGMLGHRAEMMGALKILQDTADLFDPSFTGTLDATMNAVTRMFGHPATAERVDPKTGQVRKVSEEDFRVSYDMLQKELRKALMGTAVSPTEVATNPLAFPNASDRDADTTIPAFFRMQYRNLVSRITAQDEAMARQRRSAPLTFAQRYQQLNEISGATSAAGKNALGFTTDEERRQAIAERIAEEVKRGWVIP